MHIRPAVVADAPAIMDIYNPAVETSTATFDLTPRTLAEQQAWLADRSGARIVLVAVADPGDEPGSEDEPGSGGQSRTGGQGRIMGFAAISPYRDRAAYRTTVEDSVYIDPRYQGRGVGRALLEALIEAARAHGFHTMIARVVSDHTASLALHTACGFTVVGTEREVGRKFGRWLDVTLMQRML